MSIEVCQLFEKETSTYTYIVYEKASREALIIDSVDVCFERDMDLINKLGLKLKLILETHIHADHISGAYLLKDKTSAQIGVSMHAETSCADLKLQDGQTLSLGSESVQCFETPGHTSTCISFLVGGNLFTGDTLLIRGCGRTDFQEGSNETLFASVREKIFGLPDETRVYPGHDYKGFTRSTVGFEKQHNPRLGIEKSFQEFEEIMNSLNLAQPKKIKEAVPANLNCGRKV